MTPDSLRDIQDLLSRFRASCEKHLADFIEDNKKGRSGYCVNWADLSVVDVEFTIGFNDNEPTYTLHCLIEEGKDATFEALLASCIQPEWEGYYVSIRTEW